MKRTLLLSAVAVLSFVSVASAQPKKAAPPPPKEKAPHVKVLDMGAEDLSADVPTGELMPINVRDQFKSTSLIRIRTNFIDLILKSAEDLS